MPTMPRTETANSAQLADLCTALEATWYAQIPITNALAVRVASFDGASLCVEADFNANINLHGTAFAGSLYAVSALCGWSMVHLQLALAGLGESDASIVLAEGHIRYLAPVREAIRATCLWEGQDDAITALCDGARKQRIPLTSVVAERGREGAIFTGRYAVLV